MTTAMMTVETNGLQSRNFFGGNLIERFVRFAGVAEKSAATYKTALRQLAKYFVANNITTPTREDLEMWRDGLIADKKSPATVQLYLTSAKLFFRWTAQENLYPDISDHLKAKVRVNHEHKKDALTARQAGGLIVGVNANFKKSRELADRRKWQSALKAKRDRAILALMMSCGLRCIEVNRADVADLIHEFGRTYLLIQGKGHDAKDSKILVPGQVENLIREYLQARGNVGASDPLFVSAANCNRGVRLSTQSISKMVKANLRAADMDTPRLTAHSLRHTAATTMIFAGVELTQVQQVLRHVNINTTMVYNNAVNRMKNTAEQTAADSIFAAISA